MKTSVLTSLITSCSVSRDRRIVSHLFNRDIKKGFNRRKAFPVFLRRAGCRGQYSKAVAQTLSLLGCEANTDFFLYMVPEISLIPSSLLSVPSPSLLFKDLCFPEFPSHFDMLLLTEVLHLTQIHLNYFPARLTQLYASPPPDSYTVLKAVAS